MKIRFLIIKSQADFESLVWFLSIHRNIEEFRIDFFLNEGATSKVFLPEEEVLLAETLGKLPRLTSLYISECFTPQFMQLFVGKSEAKVRHVKFISQFADDEMVSLILKSFDSLETLNISRCYMINGSFFQFLEKTPKLEVMKVNLDDYRLNLLKQLLKEKNMSTRICKVIN